MKSRPILFSAPMVRAILAGTKTQTRRVVKVRGVEFIAASGDSRNDPTNYGYEDPDTGIWCLLDASADEEAYQISCPYGVPGDELWVRENCWIAPPNFGERSDTTHTDDEGRRRLVAYDADMNGDSREVARKYGVRISPSIHMPRWASRLTLVVRSVRVERLSAITEGDVIAEGFPREPRGAMGQTVRPSIRDAFLTAFRDMHNLASDADPWVWVVTFDRKEPT